MRKSAIKNRSVVRTKTVGKAKKFSTKRPKTNNYLPNPRKFF